MLDEDGEIAETKVFSLSNRPAYDEWFFGCLALFWGIVIGAIAITCMIWMIIQGG